MKKFLYILLCGFFLGISVFAPGISGSVIAIIMGIYEDILTIISNPFKNFKKNFMFLLPMGIGVLLSAIVFVLGLKVLLETYEKATYFLFIGLILGNIPVIYSEIKEIGIKKRYFTVFVPALIIAFYLGILSSSITADSLEVLPKYSGYGLGGLLAGASALIPGMSVSMILILTNVYSSLIDTASQLLHMDFTHIWQFVVFMLMALIGIVSTSRIIKYAFEKAKGFANSAVLGFIIGSLLGILIPAWQMQSSNFSWWIGIFMLIIGSAISIGFVYLSKKLEIKGESK